MAGRIGTLARSVRTARGGALGMVQTASVQLIIVFINLATGIMTARWLGPAGRGELAAVFLWLLLPASLAAAGLQAAIVYTSRQRPQSAHSIAIAGLACGFAIYVPIAIASLRVLPACLHGYGADADRLAAVAVLASALNLSVMLSRQSLLGARETSLFNASCAASPAIYLVALVVCGARGIVTLEDVFASQLLTIMVTALIAAVFYLQQRDASWPEMRDVLRPLLSFSSRAAGIDLVNIFYANADRLILIGFVGPAELGLYAVALSFARLISILQIAVSSVLLVDLAGKSAPEVETYVHDLFLVLFWVLALACAAALVLGEKVLVLLFGASYAASAPIFDMLVIETSISCLCQVIMEAFLASGRPGYPSRVQFGYSIMLLSGLLVLVPKLGGLGAAIAMLAAASIKMILLLSGLSRIEVATPRITPRGRQREVLQRTLIACAGALRH